MKNGTKLQIINQMCKFFSMFLRQIDEYFFRGNLWFSVNICGIQLTDESMADEKGLSFEGRAELRMELAAPIMDSLEKWMERTYPTVRPKSRMGEAIGYSYTLWPRMKNYLKDGRLKIDNNLVKNALRPVVLSRKNFLFCGNHQAVENTAVICSLLASCKESGVNLREWLNDAIAKMPYYQKQGNEENLKMLLPNN